MPVNEARELEAAAKNVLNMAIGTTFINQHVPELPADALKKLAEAKNQTELQAANETLNIREAKRRAGIEHLERLPGRLLSDLFTINRIVGPGLSRQQVSDIAEKMRKARSQGASS